MKNHLWLVIAAICLALGAISNALDYASLSIFLFGMATGVSLARIAFIRN